MRPGKIRKCTTAAPGTGNVVGPAASTPGHLALFANNAGSALQDGGAPAPSATIDTTNASNIRTVTLGSGVARSVQDKLDDAVSVKDYGAKCDGSSDDTTAIQAAINSLPNDGGIIQFPQASTCKVSSTLTVGDGTTSAVSTKRGVILRGSGLPNTPASAPTFSGYAATNGARLLWAGAASGQMLQINGPLQGWGIQILYFDCGSVSGTGAIKVVSAAFADNQNVTVQNCPGNSNVSTSNPLGGYTGVGNVDSFRNHWSNTFVVVPATAAAKGIVLTGDAGGTSNTDYNIFESTFVLFSERQHRQFRRFTFRSLTATYSSTHLSGIQAQAT